MHKVVHTDRQGKGAQGLAFFLRSLSFREPSYYSVGIPGSVQGLGGLALCHFIVVVGEEEALTFLGPIPSFLGGDSLGMPGPIALSLGGDSLGMPGPVPGVDDPSPRPSLGFFSPELCEFVRAVVVVVGGIRRGGEFIGAVFTVVAGGISRGGGGGEFVGAVVTVIVVGVIVLVVV